MLWIGHRMNYIDSQSAGSIRGANEALGRMCDFSAYPVTVAKRRADGRDVP